MPFRGQLPSQAPSNPAAGASLIAECTAITDVHYLNQIYRAGRKFYAEPGAVQQLADLGRIRITLSVERPQRDSWFDPVPEKPGKLTPSEQGTKPAGPGDGPRVHVRSLISGGLCGRWNPGMVGEIAEFSLRDAVSIIQNGRAEIVEDLSREDLELAQTFQRDLRIVLV